MKKYVVPVSVGIIVLIIASYFLFFRGSSDLSRVIKNINAQNWDMAVANLKEILYEDENNTEAKGLMLYAQTRKYFDEHRVTSFDMAMDYCYSNLAQLKNLYYQNLLNEKGFLNSRDKEYFLNNSKELRQQLTKYSISTEDMTEVTNIIKDLCSIGTKEMKLAKGDEVDQALYSFLLAGNSFFGDKESGTNLLKIAKLNERAQQLFWLCGKNFVDDLREELKNDQSMINQYSKFIVIRALLKPELETLFRNNDRLESAKETLQDKDSDLSRSLYVNFSNNQIFFDPNLFENYLEVLEKNNKAGIDVAVATSNTNNIVALYGYIPSKRQYFSRFYNFTDNQLLPISFSMNKNNKIDFYNENAPIRLYNYNPDNNELTLCVDKKIKVQRTRSESLWNAYTYRYDYKIIPYTAEELESNSEIYTLNKDKASYVSGSFDKPAQNNAAIIQTSANNTATTNQNRVVEITGSNVRVRVSPSLDAEVITLLPKGLKVAALENVGNWIKIIYNGREGFVSADFAKEVR